MLRIEQRSGSLSAHRQHVLVHELERMIFIRYILQMSLTGVNRFILSRCLTLLTVGAGHSDMVFAYLLHAFDEKLFLKDLLKMSTCLHEMLTSPPELGENGGTLM